MMIVMLWHRVVLVVMTTTVMLMPSHTCLCSRSGLCVQATPLRQFHAVRTHHCTLISSLQTQVTTTASVKRFCSGHNTPFHQLHAASTVAYKDTSTHLSVANTVHYLSFWMTQQKQRPLAPTHTSD